MESSATLANLEQQLGENFRAQRLARNLTLEEVASKANVSLSSLRRLEAGSGSTVLTLLLVSRALGLTDWVQNLAPATINPATETRTRKPRMRASGRRAGVKA